MPSDPATQPEFLGDMSTWLSMLDKAQDDKRPELAREAQEQLLLRYRRPILRYVRRAMPDAGDAETIFQEFAKRFIQGKFKSFDPGRGRFREYLKRSLSNLVRDHHNKNRPHAPLEFDVPDPNAQDVQNEAEEVAFRDFVRSELLERALASVDELQRSRRSSIIATALRLKIENNAMRSAEIASRISEVTGRPVTELMVRKAIHEARKELLRSLVSQISATLDFPSLENVEDELIDLGLHSLFKSTLEGRRKPPTSDSVA